LKFYAYSQAIFTVAQQEKKTCGNQKKYRGCGRQGSGISPFGCWSGALQPTDKESIVLFGNNLSKLGDKFLAIYGERHRFW
jgi:hypothetical protein